MSDTQKNWFYNELTQWKNYGLMVLISSRPWIGSDSSPVNILKNIIINNFIQIK